MKISLSTALLLTLSATVSASVITVPVSYKTNLEHLNSGSLTRRYLQKRASTDVPLTNIQNDIIYTIPMGLGTPAQQFNVIIDTGSPTTWVSATSCVSTGCLKTNKFDCSLSSTCVPSTQGFKVSYVSGQSVIGNYSVDEYTIGSLKFRGVAGIVYQNQAKLPSSVDGLMGLWYVPSGANIPILNVLKNSTALTENKIGVWLQRSQASKTLQPGGEITFGGVNTARYTGEITYVNCVGQRPWSLSITDLTVGGVRVPVNGALGTIDTGTTAMLMPKAAADVLNGAIPGAVSVTNQGGVWFLPCQGNTPITITFGTYTAIIPYTSLAMQSTRQSTNQGFYCQSAAMFPTGATATIDEWLIGDVFLTNVYSVYDFGTNAATGGRIGFAKLAASAAPPNPSGGTGNNTGGGGGDGNLLPSAAAVVTYPTASVFAIIFASAIYSML